MNNQGTPTIRYYVTLKGGEERVVDITESPSGGATKIELDGVEVQADFIGLGGDLHSLVLDGHSREMVLTRDGSNVQVMLDGRKFDATVYDEVSKALSAIGGAATAGASVVEAPMPGVVIDVPVSVGDSIIEGQSVLVLEAMKMQNELTAEAPGIVESIEVKTGDTVESGQVVVKLKAAE